MSEKGIDISHWQGDNIDWDAVAKDNDEIKYVFVKATQGTSSIDSNFKKNIKGAKSVGLKVGAYHFANFRNIEEAVKEAEYFASQVKGIDFENELVLDLESNRGGLDKKSLTDASIAFLERVKARTGENVAIYINKNYYDNYLDMSRILPKYKLWIARYGVSDSDVKGDDYWQFTDKGKVDGINGFIDMDITIDDGIIVEASKVPSKTQVVKKVTSTIKKNTIYVVKKGDSLTKIAKNFGVNLSDLVKVNHIKDKDVIVIGERLTIPSKSAPKSASKPVSEHEHYIVKAGDIVSKIASEFNVTSKQIQDWNKLDKEFTIFPDQKLIVK